MSSKYKSTYHLPISQTITKADKIMAHTRFLEEGEIVITEKMDGECTTIHRHGCHARSVDGKHHPSRDWVKGFAASISPFMPEDMRFIVENLYAKHSISYDALPSYAMGFGAYQNDTCLSWDDTMALFAQFGITPVPVLYRGEWKKGLFENIAKSLDLTRQEGFVVRRTQSFSESQMPLMMGKYVRAHHVQTDKHWMWSEIIPNKLKESS